jgi:hypothetical protein
MLEQGLPGPTPAIGTVAASKDLCVAFAQMMHYWGGLSAVATSINWGREGLVDTTLSNQTICGGSKRVDLSIHTEEG